MFFQGWQSISQIIILSVITYVAIVIILRLSGKRTLSSFNAFDFLISVTVGSISATTILSNQTKFFEGIAAIVTLVVLQYIVSKVNMHSKVFSKVIRSDPTLLYYDGQYISANLKKMRVTKEDILQEVRKSNGVTMDKVYAVILESNGKISAVTSGSKENLQNIKKYQ